MFTLPLEFDHDEYIYVSARKDSSVNEPLVTVVTTEPQVSTSIAVNESQEETPRFSQLKFTWRMIRWHICIYLAITGSLFAYFYYAFDDKQKKIILQALSFCDDWRQLIFFFGIYVSFAVKKVSDVGSVSDAISL